MDSLRHAASLLSASENFAGAARLLSFLGFEETPLRLDARAVHELALHSGVVAAHVARGQGSLRALVLESESDITTRELVQHTASRLASKVPHLLWTVVALNSRHREISISCWESGKRQPRIVALIVDRAHALESDAETICALAAAQSTSDVLTHVRWIELLGREAITRRFFRALHEVVANLATSISSDVASSDRRELAILLVSRLLFLSFLESKGWLDRDFDFLGNRFAHCVGSSGGFHRRVLDPLFFGTLNTRLSSRSERARQFGRIPFLNGGLFTRSHLERRLRSAVFPDEAIGEVFSRLLTSYRFSAREDSALWSETAIDPEILGKAFEALMAAAERKTSGAFYTPQRLVEHTTEAALVAALAPDFDRGMLRSLFSIGELPDPADRQALLGRITAMRILDPACGSGAFLVHALERVAELRLRLGELGTAAVIRRRSLAASIFGVDVNPMAVWLCQLRLWLSIVIDGVDPDPMSVAPLPNLDRQIRVGDSLAGGSFTAGDSRLQGRKLAALRARYIRAVGARKVSLSRQLDRTERAEAIAIAVGHCARLRAERRELIIGVRAVDLFGERSAIDGALVERMRALRGEERATRARVQRLKTGAALPFAFNVHFADVAASAGFEVVVGNPPWVRIHNISPAARRALRKEFTTFRSGAWAQGAALGGSGAGFSNQIDLAALFVERSISLLRDRGAVALLLPSKLWRSLSGGGVRELIRERLELAALEDMTEARSGFDAAVYPSLLVGRRRDTTQPHANETFAAAVFRKGSALQWEHSSDRLALDDSPGSPWVLVPAEVRDAFDIVAAAGLPLASSALGRPMLGVKTGCNAAFVIHTGPSSGDAPSNESAIRVEEIPTDLLRPVVRGETLSPWRFRANGERILWTHAPDGRPFDKLPPPALRWLSRWRSELERRTDNHGSPKWWSLHRTDGALGRDTRVVWGDFGKSPSALVLESGSDVVPLNTCYVIRCHDRLDALALTALLNGPLLAAWLNTIAEPARGGYRRYLGWTVALMPIPRDWIHAREELLPIAERAMRGETPTQYDLLTAALRAFRLKRSRVESLLSWATTT